MSLLEFMKSYYDYGGNVINGDVYDLDSQIVV